MVEPRLKTTNAVRVLILLALALAGVMVTGIITIILNALHVNIRWGIVLQDILVFIVPAILLAVIAYQNPWRFLEVDKAPRWQAIAWVTMVWAVSMPALNWLVDWNQNVHLPACMSHWEQYFRTLEDTAEALTKQLLTVNSVTDLLLAVIVVGVMAGVSEEFFFRGALMGITRRGRANIHLVIWLVAIAFSAFHFQFFGFVPRMLLGAWFGYLLVWTRCLWVPIFAHVLNNSMVVVFEWLGEKQYVDGEALEHLGVPQDGSFAWMALVSAIATTALIVMGYHIFSKKMTQN